MKVFLEEKENLNEINKAIKVQNLPDKGFKSALKFELVQAKFEN